MDDDADKKKEPAKKEESKAAEAKKAADLNDLLDEDEDWDMADEDFGEIDNKKKEDSKEP